MDRNLQVYKPKATFYLYKIIVSGLIQQQKLTHSMCLKVAVGPASGTRGSKHNTANLTGTRCQPLSIGTSGGLRHFCSDAHMGVGTEGKKILVGCTEEGVFSKQGAS